MKQLICVIVALVITLAAGREGRSVYQVICHDSIRTYAHYERMDIDYENDICN